MPKKNYNAISTCVLWKGIILDALIEPPYREFLLDTSGKPSQEDLTHTNNLSIAECATRMMGRYFKTLDGERPSDVYKLILTEVERPLLKIVLQKTKNNQSKAALWLGFHRRTLLTKMKRCGLA